MLKLPDTIYSPAQLEAVVADLTQAMTSRTRAGVKAMVADSKTGLPEPALGEEAAAVVALNQVPTEGLEKFVEELRRLLDEAPRLYITLAAMPAEGLKKQLATWLRANVQEQALIEFSYHNAILGGMVVRAGSRVFDWSFRRQILAAAPDFGKAVKSV